MTIKHTTIGVGLTFVEDVLGTWPADRELHTRYVSSKAPAPWLQAEEGDAIPEVTYETGVTVFPQDDKGLFLYNFHIKGALKEAANVLKDQLVIKNARAKVDNYVFINPRRLYFVKNGATVTEPDGVLERPLRAQTMQGPRVALAASEYVAAPVNISFEIMVLDNKEITPDVIEVLLQYGAYKGVGQWRNGGFGQYTYELIKPGKPINERERNVG